MNLQEELEALKAQVAAKQAEIDGTATPSLPTAIQEQLDSIEAQVKGMVAQKPVTSLDLFAESHQRWTQARDAKYAEGLQK